MRLAVDDAQRQPLDERGLADAGFPDQHRIVLGTPLQDLDRAPDFLVAADDGIDLALLGAAGQVVGVFLQRLAVLFGIRVRNRPVTLQLGDRLHQALGVHTAFAQQFPDLSPILLHRKQEQFGCDVLVAAILRKLVADVEDALQVGREPHFAFLTGHSRKSVEAPGKTVA